MERLIDLKESGETSSEALMQPSPEVRIKENRNYLEEAKKALAEVGGNYQPTEREMLSEDFDQHVGEWKSEYDNYNILDGKSWELEFIFADKYKKKQWQGANAWPWNWDDLLEALQIKEDGCNGNCIDNWWK